MKKIEIFLLFVLIMQFIYIPVLSANESTQIIEIADSITDKKQNVQVSLSVYPENLYNINEEEPEFDEIIYFMQTQTDENGYFRFYVELDFSYEYYTAYVRVSGEEQVREYILRKPEEFYETFDSYENGIPQGWTRIGGVNEYFTKMTGEQALCISPKGKEGVIAKFFDDIQSTGIMYISYRFQSSGNGILGLRLLTENYNGYNRANEQNMDESFYAFQNGNIGAYYGTQGWDSCKIFASYVQNEWYDVDIWLDLDNNIITYYFDDEKTFTTSIPEHSYMGLCFAYESKEGSAYIDDICIKKTDRTDINKMKYQGIRIPDYIEKDIMLNMKAIGAEKGNIFFGETDTDFVLNIQNNGSMRINENVKFEILDESNNIVWEKEDKVLIKANSSIEYELKPQIEKYGIYSLKIEVYDIEKAYTFSKCVKNSELNEKAGVNVHFNWPVWGDVETDMSLIKNAGFGITRSGWSDSVENGEFVKYSEDTQFSNYIDISDSFGMQMLAKVDDNGVYRTDNQHIVTGEEELKKVEAYYKQLTEYYGDKLKYVEVKNECDLNIWRDNLYTYKNYADVLKAIYKGVKSANPDVKVVAFASAIIQSDFFDPMFKEEIIDSETSMPYFDIISVHPYHEYAAPEVAQTFHGGNSILNANWYKYSLSLRDILDKYGLKDIECWASEIGWDTYTTDDLKSAAYSVRTMILNDIYKCFDKILFYNFQNNGCIKTNTEQNYGMIECWYDLDNPYGAKPSYLALSNYNKMLSGFELDSYEICNSSEDNVIYKCKYKNNNSEKLVLWSVNKDEEVSVEVGDVKYFTVYDMYGNATKYENTDGIFNLTIGNNPVYIELKPYTIEFYNNNDIITAFSEDCTEFIVKAKANCDYNEKIMIVAQYLEERLISADIVNFDVNDEAWYSVDNSGQIDEVKAFIVDGVEFLKPVCSPGNIKKEEIK